MNFSETKIKCKQHKGMAFDKDCKQCWYAWGFDKGFKAGHEQGLKDAHCHHDCYKEGFRAGQESHINNKTLANILYRNGYNKALEEVKKILAEDSDTCTVDITKEHVHTRNFKRKIEALKKKEEVRP
jgi:hypothetical protein